MYTFRNFGLINVIIHTVKLKQCNFVNGYVVENIKNCINSLHSLTTSPVKHLSDINDDFAFPGFV